MAPDLHRNVKRRPYVGDAKRFAVSHRNVRVRRCKMSRRSNMEGRRRVPRVSADWPGRYRIEGDPPSDWGDCTIIDISVAGVGVELFGAVPEDLIGCRLAVE